MKRITAIIFTVVLIGILSGCSGNSAVPAGSSDVNPTTGPAADISEPDRIDDSYSFHVPDTGDISINKYFIETVLPEYAEAFTAGGRIIDFNVSTVFDGGGAIIYGWVLLSGPIKEENNWRSIEINGDSCYCRSIFASASVDCGEWQVRKSTFMKPAESIKQDSSEYFPDIKGLVSAELYVNQLGQGFSINDAPALRSLEKALSRDPYTSSLPTVPLSSAEFFNPLYLYFEDGSVRLIETIGSGAPGNDCFGISVFQGPESIFEIMSVPLQAEGYSKLSDGSVMLSYDKPSLFVRDTGEVEYSFTVSLIYGADGKLINIDSPDQYKDKLFQKFSYDDAGRLVRKDTEINSELVNIEEFEYNSRGLLRRLTSYSPDMSSGYYREYLYDSSGRITAELFYYLDGTPGGIESNVYIWYDEAGNKHSYSFNPDGSINGEAPEEIPLRKQ